MLVLSRRLQEQIRIGDQITITILRVKGNTVRIGIEAPRDTRILRAELPALESDEPATVEAHMEVDCDTTSRESGAIGMEVESCREPQPGHSPPFGSGDSCSRQLRLNRIKNRLRGHWTTPAAN